MDKVFLLWKKEKAAIKLPTNLDDAKSLGRSFAIPGSVVHQLEHQCVISYPGHLVDSLYNATSQSDLKIGLVEENAHHMLFYIIFLRITPIFPNWLINIASPFVDVPFPAFFFGTFIGVAPPSLLFIETGLSLNELLMMENPFTFKRIAFITTLGAISLSPRIVYLFDP
ncbi:transmembrane protein 41B [Trichinella spiralis]|uniref:transmembrane protein 41B n=1 Tax=Trichinella spiralis TaxID=6334 RepID=UPI0001EFECE7|nr:transmembrane protein 41B [Trichinella spiralis]